MADIGDTGAAVGDEVVLVGAQGGERITADEIAAREGTINYEVVTRISSRIPRITVG
jgi:alanine racemase